MKVEYPLLGLNHKSPQNLVAETALYFIHRSFVLGINKGPRRVAFFFFMIFNEILRGCMLDSSGN